MANIVCSGDLKICAANIVRKKVYRNKAKKIASQLPFAKIFLSEVLKYESQKLWFSQNATFRRTPP